MENTTLKAENLKPIILKAGVPLAVSFVGVIYAWIMTKKRVSTKASSSIQGTKHEESFHNFASMENDEETSTPLNRSSVLSERSEIHDNQCLEQEIITGLRIRIEDLQMRELALKVKFDRFCDMKEQESLLMEMKNMLSLETARVELLDREVSSIERETMRLENFVVQYLKMIEQLECLESEKRLLQRKVQRLVRKSKAQSCLIKEQTLKIKAEEAEIFRSCDALQTRNSVINKLEDEIRDLQRVLDQLQDEKNELVNKLDRVEKAYAAKVEAGDVSKEEYNQLLNELEQIKKERATEVEEFIHMRWTNACLRHELMKQHEQQKQQRLNQDRDHMGLEFEASCGVMHYDSDHELHDAFLKHHNLPCFGSPTTNVHGAFPKRRKLLRRLKHWMEGHEKARIKPEGENSHEIKCLGRHSVSHKAKELALSTTRSCSSA